MLVKLQYAELEPINPVVGCNTHNIPVITLFKKEHIFQCHWLQVLGYFCLIKIEKKKKCCKKFAAMIILFVVTDLLAFDNDISTARSFVSSANGLSLLITIFSDFFWCLMVILSHSCCFHFDLFTFHKTICFTEMNPIKQGFFCVIYEYNSCLRIFILMNTFIIACLQNIRF